MLSLNQPLVIAGRTFRSRLILGTGKFSAPEAMRAALAASGTEMVTVALRRADLSGK
jgi:thiazole synthase